MNKRFIERETENGEDVEWEINKQIEMLKCGVWKTYESFVSFVVDIRHSKLNKWSSMQIWLFSFFARRLRAKTNF